MAYGTCARVAQAIARVGSALLCMILEVLFLLTRPPLQYVTGNMLNTHPEPLLELDWHPPAIILAQIVYHLHLLFVGSRQSQRSEIASTPESIRWVASTIRTLKSIISCSTILISIDTVTLLEDLLSCTSGH